ncbi:MAG: hypothetical protein U5K69_01640 [Balneolaceae bacterium]|nr:hypothetical protein [Balneolaceae bacterium]
MLKNVDFTALLLGIALVTMGVTMLNDDGNSPNPNLGVEKSGVRPSEKNYRNEDDWIGAYEAVQKAITEELDSPSSLQFSWNSNSVEVERLDRGSKQNYKVKSYVDIPDRSGDSVRVHFTAQVYQTKNDSWKVYQLNLGG